MKTQASRNELQEIQDAAAESALRARKRIESAVDTGELPLWVMDACTVLERASMLYGVTSAQIKAKAATVTVANAKHSDVAVVLH